MHLNKTPKPAGAELCLSLPSEAENSFYDSDLDPVLRMYLMAQLQPHKCAVEDYETSLSYAQLSHFVDRRAAEISAFGVSVGDHIGAVAPSSVDSVITQFAVWKLGLVYVPLNPDLPIARLVAQVHAAKLTVILECAPSKLQQRLNVENVIAWPTDLSSLLVKQMDSYESYSEPDYDNVERSCLETKWPEVLGAYVIFTSGTTGTPKPVLVSRKNCMAHTEGFCKLIDLSYEARVLQICASSFDISIEEIIPTISQGATLILAPRDAKQSPERLDKFIRSSAITVANLPTALWSMWLEFLQRQSLSVTTALEIVLIGGEACPPQRVRQWFEVAGSSVKCLNAYGPTETTITVSAWELCVMPLDKVIPHVPIGSAMLGVEWSIDKSSGSSDELLIGGDLVSLGYYGHPKATAENFIPNPNAKQIGQRSYRSGDAAYCLTDDELVISGRIDRQIKIHGYRIELDEIETLLIDLDQVMYAFVEFVSASDGEDTSPLLIAYIVPKDKIDDIVVGEVGRARDSVFYRTLDQGLSIKLPSYMRPHCYCVLESLPINANGKIDRQSLPRYRYEDVPSLKENNTLEEKENCLYSVLGFLPEDRSATFIQLGGDSILAMTLSGRLWDIGYDLDVEQILSKSPILKLLESAQKKSTSSKSYSSVNSVSAFVREQCQKILRASDGKYTYVAPTLDSQQAMLYYSLLSQQDGQYIEQIEGSIGNVVVDKFEQAWQTVVKRHDILTTSFNLSVEGLPLQVVHADMEISIHIRTLTSREDQMFEEFLEQYLIEDRASSFDLMSGPLMRVVLLKRKDLKSHLVWTYHHSILDGWSDVLVLDEVFANYDMLCERDQLAPPPPQADYREFLDWYANQVSSECEEVWFEYLGLGVAQALPSLSQRQISTGPESVLSYALSQKQIDRVLSLAADASVTVNLVFNFAFGLALASALEVRDVVIGTVNALRPREVKNIESLVGPLLGVNPLRLRFDIDQQILDSLRSLSNERLAIGRFPRVPYQHLISHLSEGGTKELFDAILVFENYPVAMNPVVNTLRSHTKTNYPLNIIVWPSQRYTLEVRFSSNVIEQQRVESLVGTFLEILGALSSSQKLGELLSGLNLAIHEQGDCSAGQEGRCRELII